MTYNVVYDVQAPIEAYHALHAAVREVIGSSDVGMLAHIGRPTETGFQVIEVWESKERLDDFNRDLMAPVMAKFASDGPPPALELREFELCGLVIPSAGLWV